MNFKIQSKNNEELLNKLKFIYKSKKIKNALDMTRKRL